MEISEKDTNSDPSRGHHVNLMLFVLTRCKYNDFLALLILLLLLAFNFELSVWLSLGRQVSGGGGRAPLEALSLALFLVSILRLYP